MSRTLLQLWGAMSKELGDYVSSTTTAAGSGDKNTFIDASMACYPDEYFKDWYVHLTVADEYRRIESFLSPSGTFKAPYAFSALVATSIAYTLHKYDPTWKTTCINQALFDVFPDYYEFVVDELYGQTDYGESPNEFNKYAYTIPSTFHNLPTEIYVQDAYYGTHTGSDDAAVLTDSAANWTVNELAGLQIHNKTDGSEIAVDSNTSTTVTGTLAGGTDNDWDKDDEYIIRKPNAMPIRLAGYEAIATASGSWQIYVPAIREGQILLLVGKEYFDDLSAIDSTVELTIPEEKVVAKKAASRLFETLAKMVGSRDATRFMALSGTLNTDYSNALRKSPMENLKGKLRCNWNWK